jgi:hypothetical protein
MKNLKIFLISLILGIIAYSTIIHAMEMSPQATHKTESKVASQQTLNKKLLKAALDNETKKVKLLIIKGADINAQDDVGNTILHFAAFHCNDELIAYLLLQPNIVIIDNKHGENPLAYAIYSFGTKDQQIKIIRLLLNHKTTSINIAHVHITRANNKTYLRLLPLDIILMLAQYKNTYSITNIQIKKALQGPSTLKSFYYHHIKGLYILQPSEYAKTTIEEELTKRTEESENIQDHKQTSKKQDSCIIS